MAVFKHPCLPRLSHNDKYMEMGKKLEWDDKYSVGVELIDEQHKAMFTTINLLIDTINTGPEKEKIGEIIGNLVAYKKFHFETEEKYFKEFNYENAEEHIAKHREFTAKLEEIQAKCGDDIFALAFELVDFLEDWLIDHLLTIDQQYKQCFAEHGLK